MGQVRYLTATEMCERLQISFRKLFDLVEYDGLPVLRLGTGPKAARRFDPRAVERWEKRNTTTTQGAA